MLAKQKIKIVSSLKHKKFRYELGLFVAEGGKNVIDLSRKFSCEMLFATQNWLENNSNLFSFSEEMSARQKGVQIFEVKTSDELKPVSFLTTPQEVVAVFKIPADNNSVCHCGLDSQLRNFQPITTFSSAVQIAATTDGLSLALDCVQNTGNLGTIIRIADWFGISNVFCSLDTTDIYNPKVVQATMGALANVNVYYVDLQQFIKQAKENEMQIFGTFLNGKNIYQQNLPKNGIIILGNEGNGISTEIANLITEKLFIPNFSAKNQTSESLNVAVAAAIVCSEFRRHFDKSFGKVSLI